MGFQYPKALAEPAKSKARPPTPPVALVADIRCATSVVAVELKLAPDQIAGMDISSEMLVLAQRKELYRRLYEVGLTGDRSAIGNAYALY